MSDLETLKPVFEVLPTGKPHISFSEMRDWQDCSYRHRLKHVQKIDLGKPSPILDFGTGVHASCENYLRTRIMDPSFAINHIREAFKKNEGCPAFPEKALSGFEKEALSILADVPAFLDETFPEWECVDAEHQLYEPIVKYPHAFKGFIDCIVKVKGKKGEDVYWIVDWKTTSWGWNSQKKSDPNVQQQLVLYKNFWTSKTGTDPKHVRCAFVLLKRSAKPGAHCELLKVSVGDVTTDRALKVLNNSLGSIRKGVALKNRGSCTYCDFRDTPHCT